MTSDIKRNAGDGAGFGDFVFGAVGGWTAASCVETSIPCKAFAILTAGSLVWLLSNSKSKESAHRGKQLLGGAVVALLPITSEKLLGEALGEYASGIPLTLLTTVWVQEEVSFFVGFNVAAYGTAFVAKQVFESETVTGLGWPFSVD